MRKTFEAAKSLDEYEIIRPCVERIEAIWIELGEPEPDDGPSTELHGKPMSHTTPDCMGDGATDDDAEAYNDLAEALFKLIDIRHIGSGIWYTQYYGGSDEWQEYVDRARNIIDDFLADDIWDRFCDLHEWSSNDGPVYQIEYDDHGDGTWLRAHLDFDGISAEYSDRESANEDLDQLREDNPDIDFRLVER